MLVFWSETSKKKVSTSAFCWCNLCHFPGVNLHPKIWWWAAHEKIGCLKVDPSHFGWKPLPFYCQLRLQNLRVEASKFEGWGFKLRGLRRYIIGGYLGTSSRQPGKRQRKREKENQKSEDQFFWHTLNCSKIELFVKSKTLTDDMIKDWWYDPRLWLKYQKATGAWNL